MPLRILIGPASAHLGAGVCRELGVAPVDYAARRFPDGELQIELQASVQGHHVVVVQATSPPVAGHLLELLLLADACRRAAAGRLTAVIPYLGYARQDRRTDGQSLGARVASDIISVARFDRLILIDAHTPAIEGFFDVPIDHLTAVPALARALAAGGVAKRIVVAPDLGAVKRARTLGGLLGLPLAMIQKTRLSGEEVEAARAIGPVAGLAPIIIDDMLSTGGTIAAAWQSLLEAEAAPPAVVAVTHGLFAGAAPDVLAPLGLERILVTDTVDVPPPAGLRIEVISLAPLVAAAIERVHGAAT